MHMPEDEIVVALYLAAYEWSCMRQLDTRNISLVLCFTDVPLLVEHWGIGDK